MKDDAGSHAVFTEQTSQMTGANVLDVIARQPWMRRTSDAVAASHPS